MKQLKMGKLIYNICSLKMILKQQPSQIQIVQEVSSILQIIEQILRIKHHQQMINNRHQRIFLQYFGHLQKPVHDDEIWARDILTLAEQKQRMHKVYKMQEIIKTIRESVLYRVKTDHIAPILKTRQGQYNMIFEIQKRNRAMISLPQSKTMHTESSRKYQKCKILDLEKLTTSNKRGKDCQNLSNEQSYDTLTRVTQDLSKMLKDAYAFEEKTKILNLKFSKRSHPTTSTSKKILKQKLSLQNISAIRCNTEEYYALDFQRFQYPEESYGLKKPKKASSKSNQLKGKRLQTNSVQNKSTLKKRGRKGKNQSIEKLQFIPLTPKPISTSKMKEGWGENLNKCSRLSLKTMKKQKMEKLEKSPILNHKSPYKNMLQKKTPHKKQRMRIGK